MLGKRLLSSLEFIEWDMTHSLNLKILVRSVLIHFRDVYFDEEVSIYSDGIGVRYSSMKLNILFCKNSENFIHFIDGDSSPVISTISSADDAVRILNEYRFRV